ncbi:MAG: hypothetical protein WC209_10555 [Ignavibacteriaceae bacterium]|jgi:hypothetical protein
MIKYFSVSLVFVGLFFFYACNEKLVDNPVANKAPLTKVFLNPDSTISQQQSTIKLHWSGDDPDGFVVGYYISWDGTNWSFTSKNDSLFNLQIGAVDTIFSFKVSAVDNSGNGKYDSQTFQNNFNYGSEPFTDLNGNNVWDSGEPFTDIGLIDPNPASLKLPIKNTAPKVEWNILSTHPDTSFTVMSFGWNASDIDGEKTIQHINIALNDTNNFVSINGSVKLITIRTKDFSNPNPLMDILIDGDPNNQAADQTTGQKIKLPGLVYNANNIFYVQAEDISGAKSIWLSSITQKNSTTGLTAPKWFVKKPKGKFVVVDDSKKVDNAPDFYASMLNDSVQIKDKYDFYDIYNQKPPFLNSTFLETIKLFDCVIWYSDNDPSLDLASASVQKYTTLGGKIFFSLQFPQSVELTQIQGFLPIAPDSSDYATFLPTGSTAWDTTHTDYPKLQVTSSLARARSFYLSNIGVTPIYYFPKKELKGFIGFENSEKNIFFIGMPLHRINGVPGSVKNLLTKVLFQDFNLTP